MVSVAGWTQTVRSGARLSSQGGQIRASDVVGAVDTRTLKGKQWLEAIRGTLLASGVVGGVTVDARAAAAGAGLGSYTEIHGRHHQAVAGIRPQHVAAPLVWEGYGVMATLASSVPAYITLLSDGATAMVVMDE